MWFVPYHHDMDKLKESLNVIPSNESVFHFDIIGFDYGNGYILKEALDIAILSDLSDASLDIIINIKNEVTSLISELHSHSFGESGQNKFDNK